MGSCLSKKSACATTSPVLLPNPPEKFKSDTQSEKKKTEEETVVKKEIFIIKHRKSHEIERQKSDEEKCEAKKAEEIIENSKNASNTIGFNGGLGIGNSINIGAAAAAGGGAPVRTSSCTKEEVDAILIQCGRLSRSSSTGKAALSSENGGRKYSGSKRSYDFDNETGKSDGNKVADGNDDAVARERENRRRERHRQSQGRRRTPSREREKDQAAAQQRSGSRERGGSGGGGRRVSRSPGRRSESPIPNSSGTNSNSNSNSSAAINGSSRPGKMISVPATISSLAMDKSTNGDGVKRIQVKRNASGGDARTAGSPRARSPARVRVLNENQNAVQQPLSLSRSNSRKAEHSPYRRNPLADIDTNIISQPAPIQKPNADNKTVQVAENRNNNSKNQQQLMAEPEALKPAAVARSRSSRLSRDLDINPETLSSPNPPPSSSYTALLLEDIQNFHQKNAPTPTPTPPTAFSLPPCVTKACSILEAVADLNSSTGSNLSSTFEDRRKKPITEQINKTKIQQDMQDPILESMVVDNDDLIETSFHKYVTVRRGGVDDDLEEQESSGSNSFVASSGWEPNSAESTDRWMSSSSSSRTVSRVSAKKRDSNYHHQQNGIGRARIGIRGPAAAAAAAAAGST